MINIQKYEEMIKHSVSMYVIPRPTYVISQSDACHTPACCRQARRRVSRREFINKQNPWNTKFSNRRIKSFHGSTINRKSHSIFPPPREWRAAILYRRAALIGLTVGTSQSWEIAKH